MEIVIQINNEIDSEQPATVADVDIATLEKKGVRSWTVRYIATGGGSVGGIF